MKNKRIKRDSSSEESDESQESMESISSSDTESDVSSTLERRHRKKRKRANSSESNSESEAAQKRSKKRKHKKKKKKHNKKKRQVDDSGSEEVSSASDCEMSFKKKKKYKKQKYDKKLHTSSISDKDFSESEPEDRRLQSVVKERRSSEGSQPSRTYYQKEYQRSPSVLEYRSQEAEVERFYRGSSKDRNRAQYHQQNFNRNVERYENQHNQERYDRNHERYVQEYRGPNNNFHPRGARECEVYERPSRYDSRDPPNDRQFQRKPRGEEYVQNQGYDRYNQNEGRVDVRRRDPEEQRDFRPRPGPSDYDRYRDQNYGSKRPKYNEATYPEDRSGEVRRGRLIEQERPPDVSQRRELRSPQNRNRDMKRDPDIKFRNEERNRDRLVKDERDRKDRRNNEGRDESARFRENRSERPRRSPNSRKSPPRRSPGAQPGPSERDRNTRREARTEVKREKSSPKPREKKSRFSEADDKNYTWGKTTVKQEGKDPAEKEKPNFGLSGKLTADVNTVNGVVIKYTEPDDAKQPKRRWRFYPFKGDKALPILYIHRQSFFLLGRDKKVVDIHLEHPSVSKQHAALQYRATAFTRADGTQGRRVRPYIIDLDSANGTFVNNKKIDPRRYVELLERDVVKFGFSQREYVLLHENSKDDAQDDDQQDPVPAVTTTEQIKQEKRTKMERAADGD